MVSRTVEEIIEVEVKARVHDLKALEALLVNMGFEVQGTEEHRDLYLQHPVRDFGQTDEALRIRWRDHDVLLTYKGPKLDDVTKSREEMEIGVAGDPSEMLERVGFRPIGEVRKRRTVLRYEKDGIRACLDRVDLLGDFVELEMASSESGFEGARSYLLALAKRLGLEDLERRSYLELLLSMEGVGPPVR